MPITICETKPRNTTVDILRGIAILMVLINHVCNYSATDFLSSTLGNVIWSLQMPLFILTSSYCMRYTNQPETARELLRYIGKRSMALLVPWVVWVVFVKGILFGKERLASFLLHTIYNMDSVSYWFLFSLWTITMLFAAASYLSNKIGGGWARRAIVCVGFLFAGAGLLTLIGRYTGFTFLGMKLSIYYIPQFATGFLFGCLQNACSEKPWFLNAKRLSVFPALVVYALIILNINLYSAETTVINLALRFFAAITGTVVLVSTVRSCMELTPDSRLLQAFRRMGCNSMELYTVHPLYMAGLTATAAPMRSLDGFLLYTINFILMFVLTVITARVLSANRMSRLLLFGKR